MSDPSQEPFGEPDIKVTPDVAPGTIRPETARDGSPASRPGDPSPAPASDGAPILSTDPLGID